MVHASPGAPRPCRCRHRRGVRDLSDLVAAQAAGRERENARDLARGSGGRCGLPEEAVHGDRGRRGRAVPGNRALQQARLGHGVRLPDRSLAVRGCRLHRDERGRALELAHRRSSAQGPRAGAERRLPRRIGHGPARGRPRPLRRHGLLLAPDGRVQPHAALGDQRSDRPRVRWFAHLRLRPSRRRHLHEGRRRRRRPRRQDRGRDPRGRSAQPRRDRGQRRRQRRRLRRHGCRPLRDLRRHGGRRDAARHADSRRRPGPAVSPAARTRRRLGDHVGDRHVLRPPRQGRERGDQRALQGGARRDGPVGARVHPDHQGVLARAVLASRISTSRRSSASS